MVTIYQNIIKSSANTSPIIILPGLLGSSRNWQTMAQSISSRFHRPVITLDLRNHGRSVQFDPITSKPLFQLFTWDTLASDLQKILIEECPSDQRASIIGHSLGGQVVMQSLFRPATSLFMMEKIDKAIIVDIGPGTLFEKVKHQASPLTFLHAMKLVEEEQSHSQPPTFTRSHAIELFKQFAGNPPDSIVQFIFTNYGPLPHSLPPRQGFLIPVTELSKALVKLASTQLRPVSPLSLPIYFIKGANSSYLEPSSLSLIPQCFSNYQIINIPRAGHWPHHEQPEAFLQALKDIFA